MAPKPRLQSESRPVDSRAADPRPADPELTDDGHVVEPSADDYRHATELEINHDWYKSAVFYEVLVRAFYDSDGNGTGDLRGLIEKLDYLEWLGVDCLWLPPFYESPLRLSLIHI